MYIQAVSKVWKCFVFSLYILIEFYHLREKEKNRGQYLFKLHLSKTKSFPLESSLFLTNNDSFASLLKSSLHCVKIAQVTIFAQNFSVMTAKKLLYSFAFENL